MGIPKQADIEVPLLRALADAGGEATPADLYPVLAKELGVTEDDQAEQTPTGVPLWKNRVQWARQALVAKGELGRGEWGIWTITDLGRARLKAGQTSPKGRQQVAPGREVPSLGEISEAYENAFRVKLLDRLLQLTPVQFEHFGKAFLHSYGFVQLQVTQVSRDGGIDGHGRLRVGVTYIRAAFQCKRWNGQVGRPEVDRFRGAIQGEFEQGIFFTTSEFSAPAKEASIKRGAVPIVLLDGPEIVRVMIEKGLGVEKRPLYVFEEVAIPGVDERPA